MSANLKSNQSSYNEDTPPPIQNEESSVIGELVMPTNSTHHLSEFELHGLQAAFTEPDEDIQQETEEGHNSQRTELVTSSPSLPDLLPYFTHRWQDRHSSSLHIQVATAALIMPRGHMVVRNSISRSASENRTCTLIQALGRRLDETSNRMDQLTEKLILLECRVQMLEASRGEYVWRIEDIAHHRREAVSGRTVSLYSLPFYIRGYRMCAGVCLNGAGSGRGTHLSLFLVIMRGDHDGLLQWPFKHSVTFSLFDQSGHRDHLSHTFQPDHNHSAFQRPQTDMNTASGFPQFAPLAVLMDGHYVQDDALYISVKIRQD